MWRLGFKISQINHFLCCGCKTNLFLPVVIVSNSVSWYQHWHSNTLNRWVKRFSQRSNILHLIINLQLLKDIKQILSKQLWVINQHFWFHHGFRSVSLYLSFQIINLQLQFIGFFFFWFQLSLKWFYLLDIPFYLSLVIFIW